MPDYLISFCRQNNQIPISQIGRYLILIITDLFDPAFSGLISRRVQIDTNAALKLINKYFPK